MCTCVCVTVDGLQLVVAEDECVQLGLGARGKRWRPLQVVVAQVQILQLTERLRDIET